MRKVDFRKLLLSGVLSKALGNDSGINIENPDFVDLGPNEILNIYEMNEYDYHLPFSPKIIERIGGNYLVIDEIEEDFDCFEWFIQLKSGKLLVMLIILVR